MDFRISDTFTDSLARLTDDEQKAVKTTAFDLQLNPAQPGMQFHRIERAKDPNFWSVRVSRDIRVIVHRTASSLMLCYAGHHDAAYAWAERRKIERHPTTGAAQLVEIRETVREIIVPRYVEAVPRASSPKRFFESEPEWVLLQYGVPPEWLADVRAATEDTIFDVMEHLPPEAAEALLEFAATGIPPVLTHPALPPTADAFQHPDAQRRFRVIADIEELKTALEAPWEKWIVFLHPDQRRLVERDFSGPARAFGSAGTGKTIVALHRAVHLARTNADARVLLTTLSDPLANSLRARIRLLLGSDPRVGERLEVQAIGAIGTRLFTAQVGAPRVATPQRIEAAIAKAASAAPQLKFSHHFLATEWTNVVDAWQLTTWQQYRDVKRLGRRTRLSHNQREALWSIFIQVNDDLRREGFITEAAMFTQLGQKVATSTRPIFEHVIVDEAQDLSVAHLRFLRSLGADRINGLFFTGDLGQRIFQQPFSWKEIGIDVRGRSSRLHVNYRTSHQIRAYADRLLAPELTDVDGLIEDRRGAVSVFNGALPEIRTFANQSDEIEAVANWIRERTDDGLRAHEIAVFVRSAAELPRAQECAKRAGVAAAVIDERVDIRSAHTSLATMHLAKGLEFRAVVVMACDEDIIPLQERIESVTDESELEDVYQTERHLLYVACTRARDHLLVTALQPGSEYLEDLRAADH